METLIAIAIAITFTATGYYGTTTEGTFTGTTISESPYIQEIKVNDVHAWFVCFDGTDTVTTNDLVELSKCVAQ